MTHFICCIGFALWFLAGISVGKRVATKRWIKRFCDLAKSPETKIITDSDKVTYRFNVNFKKK